ncbi:MAG: hypothetical protein ACLPWS_15560 [Rhodomicrobium sp.]
MGEGTHIPRAERRRAAKAAKKAAGNAAPKIVIPPQTFFQRYRGAIRAAETAIIIGLLTGAITAGGDLNVAIPLILMAIAITVFSILSVAEVSPRARIWFIVLSSAFFLSIGLLVLHQSAQKAEHDRLVEEEIFRQREFRIAEELKHKLTANPAGLVPGDQPTPAMACNRHGDELNIFLGNSVFGASNFPFVPVQIKGKPAIILDKNQDGSVFTTFDIKDMAGHILAQVQRNNVFIPPLHSYMQPRQDLHSITVSDEYGKAVLKIDYVNKQAIRITGEIYSDGVGIIISDDQIFLLNNRSTFSSVSICGARIGISIG